jgi:hypothetical protein
MSRQQRQPGDGNELRKSYFSLLQSQEVFALQDFPVIVKDTFRTDGDGGAHGAPAANSREPAPYWRQPSDLLILLAQDSVVREAVFLQSRGQ